jgi:hypothetical protein
VNYLGTVRLVSLAAAVLAPTGASIDAAENKPTRPNVLFIPIDDLRDWVGFLGNQQAKTPNLDRLAARGTYFTRSYCASPLCNPSRTALLSGLRAGATGVYNNDIDWRKVVPAETITLPLLFKNSGYYVAGAGKVYHGRFPRPSDWHDYYAKGSGDEDDLLDRRKRQKGGDITRVAPDASNITIGPIAGDDDAMEDYHSVSYILKKLNEKRDQPFFLACGLKKPHLPWTVPKKYFDLYPLEAVRLPKILETDLDDVPRLACTWRSGGNTMQSSRPVNGRPQCRPIWPQSAFVMRWSAACSMGSTRADTRATPSSVAGVTTAGIWARSCTGTSPPSGKKRLVRRSSSSFLA